MNEIRQKRPKMGMMVTRFQASRKRSTVSIYAPAEKKKTSGHRSYQDIQTNSWVPESSQAIHLSLKREYDLIPN